MSIVKSGVTGRVRHGMQRGQCPGQPSLTIRSRAWLLDTGGVVSAVQSTQYIELHTVRTYVLCTAYL